MIEFRPMYMSVLLHCEQKNMIKVVCSLYSSCYVNCTRLRYTQLPIFQTSASVNGVFPNSSIAVPGHPFYKKISAKCDDVRLPKQTPNGNRRVPLSLASRPAHTVGFIQEGACSMRTYFHFIQAMFSEGMRTSSNQLLC